MRGMGEDQRSSVWCELAAGLRWFPASSPSRCGGLSVSPVAPFPHGNFSKWACHRAPDQLEHTTGLAGHTGAIPGSVIHLLPRAHPPAEGVAGLSLARKLAPPQRAVSLSVTPAGRWMSMPRPVETAIPDPLVVVLADGRLMLLFVGTAVGPDRCGAHADTIRVAALEVRTGCRALVHVPPSFVRSPRSPEMAGKSTQGSWPDLADALYMVGVPRAHRLPGVPDPGAAVLASSLAQLLGLQIEMAGDG